MESCTSGMGRFFVGLKLSLISSLLGSLASCSTGVISDTDWYYCESLCEDLTLEACRDIYHGLRCRCYNGNLIEVGEPEEIIDYD